jgi:hypothetical protein
MEIKGATQNPEEFKLYMKGITKALGVFGDTIKPEDYYEAFKYSRQAIGGLSRDFLLNYMPTMAQEFGGASTGTAI